MKCVCNMWQLSRIPCVHAMAGYMHMKMNPDLGVDEWYSQCIMFHEAPSSNMPPHIATQSTSNTMPPPPTPSTSNAMPLPPTPSPSTSNTMPPPFGSNTMPLPPTPSGSNTMPSHVAPGSNKCVGSNNMPSHATSVSTGLNKGICPLIPKKSDKPIKSSASNSRGGSRGGATSRGGSKGGSRGDATNRGGSRGGATNIDGSKGGASKRVRGSSKKGKGSSKRGRDSNTMPLQGLRDESSDEEHQFNMDMEVVYEMEIEQIVIDEDDQFWEDCARKFDQVEEHMA
ncbi:ribonuclease H-like domain-containing protein [Tanacetum coccineum]